VSNLKLAKNGIKRDLITQREIGIKCKKDIKDWDKLVKQLSLRT
jgi:hypothetical protein